MLRRGAGSQRLLTTVLFTDIVGSTERAAALGDRGWKDLVARHHAIVRKALRRFHGRELDTAGDGFFATFERPVQAIECATAIIDDLRPLDLQIRAGIHMGEAEVMGGKVGGITVHVASRAMAEAAPGEIIVTNTVREVSSGADVAFTDRGVHEFKGVPGEWHVYAVQWQRRELPPAAAGRAETGPEAAARRRGRWWAAIGGGLVGAVLIGVAAYGLLPRGGIGPSAIPQPDSALRIDAGTMGIVGGDTVWVLSRGDKILYGIPTGGGSARTIGLPGSPTAIAADAAAAWIAFGFGATGEHEGIVLRVGAGMQGQPQTISVGYGANGIAVSENGVFVINELKDSLTKIDPQTRSSAATVGLAKQPVAVATGEGSVWVVHALGKAIWRIDPATMTRTKEVTLRDPPVAVAVGFGRVWITSSTANSVVVIDAKTNASVTTISVAGSPRGIATGTDAVWVACADGTLVRIDPGSLTAGSPISLPGPAFGVAVAGEGVWVTVQK